MTGAGGGGAQGAAGGSNAPGIRRLDATVVGIVQGVGFRYWVMERALELGLTGWVANQADGSVRCVAEGSDEAVGRLLVLLHDGPVNAGVERVAEISSAGTGEFDRFRIRSLAHLGD